MANALYDLAKQGMLDGSITWTTDTIRVVLIDTDEYTVATTSDKFLSDIPLAARVATSSPLTSPTATGGVADAGDANFSVVSGSDVSAAVVYKDTGSPSSSRLIAYIDTDESGLPFTPNGGDVTITWPDDGIFSL